MKHYLAIDLGATSGRTVLSTFDGTSISMREFTRFANPQLPMTGGIYWDLPHLYNEILRALRQVAEEGIELQSIGIDTWGCDVAHFGQNGQLVGLPHCYRDPYTDGMMERFFDSVMPREELYGKTGIQFMPFNSVFQLWTQAVTGDDPFDASEHALFIPDALIYLLTGEMVCEYTVASTSQMLNPCTGDLDEGILDALHMSRDCFGRLVQPGEQVGVISEQVQQATGLGPVPVVAVASHDTASAVAAVPAQDSNYAYLSCGTWSLLGIESPNPIITDQSFKENFTNEGGLDGTTRFLKNICGLWLFEQCRKEFKDVPQSVAELSALSLESNYDGLIFPDDPAFAHPQSMCQAIREHCQKKGQKTPESPADFIRCIYRSLARRYAEVIELLRSMSPQPIERLHVIGGGSQNAILMQMTADATGLPVISGPTEGTALGNTLVQIRAAGGVKTLLEMRAIVAHSIEIKEYEPKTL